MLLWWFLFTKGLSLYLLFDVFFYYFFYLFFQKTVDIKSMLRNVDFYEFFWIFLSSSDLIHCDTISNFLCTISSFVLEKFGSSFLRSISVTFRTQTPQSENKTKYLLQYKQAQTKKKVFIWLETSVNIIYLIPLSVKTN